jgi:hypothetical protein
MDVEAEIRDLKRRVGELEGSFEFRARQVRAVHQDLLEFRADTNEKFEGVNQRFEGVNQRFARLEHGLQSLRKDLPGIVGDAVREVLRPA